MWLFPHLMVDKNGIQMPSFTDSVAKTRHVSIQIDMLTDGPDKKNADFMTITRIMFS